MATLCTVYQLAAENWEIPFRESEFETAFFSRTLMMDGNGDPELIHRFRGLHDGVTALSFAPGNGRQLAAASKDKSVLVWTLGSGLGSSTPTPDSGRAYKFSGHADEVNDVVSM